MSVIREDSLIIKLKCRIVKCGDDHDQEVIKKNV
jgi:hypothetical protein